MNGPRPADVLLDRDGVLVVEKDGYVLHPDEVRLLPGAATAVGRLGAGGHRVFVITNQSPIGRGLIDEAQMHAIHSRLSDLVGVAGGMIESYLVCPHLPADGCACRKPMPGLLYRARDSMGVDLATAVVIGDQLCDVQAARAAQCRAILVLSGRITSPPDRLSPDVQVAADLAAAVDLILEGTRTRAAA